MKLLLVCSLACLALAYAQVKDEGYGAEYGVGVKYGHENDAGYGNDKEHGYDKEYEHEEKGYDGHDKDSYGKDDHDDSSYEVEYRHGVAYNKQYVYHGIYPGHCGKDGFYFKDSHSFVICSNNNAYVQPCAPGSRNSAHDAYNYGGNYYYRDFCDVNLVDHGYAAKHHHQGYPAQSKDHHQGYPAQSKDHHQGYPAQSKDHHQGYPAQSKDHYGYDGPYYAGDYKGSYHGNDGYYGYGNTFHGRPHLYGRPYGYPKAGAY